MSEKTTKTGTLAGRPQTQSARPWRTLGRSNAPITCYSASGVKLGQEVTARAYIVELERYCNGLEKQNAQLKDGFEKKLQKRFAEGKKAGRNQRQKTANAMKVNKNKGCVYEVRTHIQGLSAGGEVYTFYGEHYDGGAYR